MDFPPRQPAGKGPRVNLDVEFGPLREEMPPPAPNQAPAPRPRRNETVARVGWVLPWIVAVIAAIAVGGLLFAAAMAAFACLAMEELFKMGRDARPFDLVAFGAAVALVLAAFYGSQYEIVIVGLATLPAMFIAALTREDRAGVTTSFAFTALAIGWIAIPFAHAVLLRQLPQHGGALLVDVLVGTFLTDTFAYFGGRMVGRHKLAPRISPNKTVEGLVIGIVGGTLAFWFAGLYQDWLTGINALVIGFCVALTAPIGDLFESLIKRDLRIKDTGRLFGPHGGILDRLDAVLFTIVVGYYLANALVYGPPPSAARTNSRSARIASEPPGVSTTAGDPAAAIIARRASAPTWPEPRFAWRSAPVPDGSRESLACNRSIEPTMPVTRSTASRRSSPAAWAWQVSKQKPSSTPWSVAAIASQSRASASKRRATAFSPPAVFSMNTGTSVSSISSVRGQRPTPSSSPSSA